jgi:hypothetical protein
MRDASSDATKAMAAAIPSGVPNGPSGITRPSREGSAPSGSRNAPVIGVSIAPGLMLLTRTPAAAYSTASDRARASTPPFDATYAAAQGWPLWPAVDARLTMVPRLATRYGSA